MWGEFDTEFIFQLFFLLCGFSQLLKCIIHWKGTQPFRKVAEKGRGKRTFPLTHKLPLWVETTFRSLQKRDTGEHYLLVSPHSHPWGRSFPWPVIKKPLGFSHPAKPVCSCGSRHLLMYGNTLLHPHPQLGYMEPGAGLMLRDKWHLAALCPYCLESAASGLPGVWIPPNQVFHFSWGHGIVTQIVTINLSIYYALSLDLYPQLV